MCKGSDAEAAAYIGIKTKQGEKIFGVGVDAKISIASVKAVLSAINRI